MKTAWAIFIGLVFAACSGPRFPYPESAIEFMRQNCSPEAPECACGQRMVQEEIPYEDWRRFHHENQSLSKEEWTRINAALNAITNACNSNGSLVTPAPLPPSVRG